MVMFCACVSSSPSRTGFLDNYSQLIPVPEAEGLFIYENPQKKLNQNDAFVLDPILVYFHPEAVNHSVNPETLMKVFDYFRSHILQSFHGRYRIVPLAGPDVCIIRIAVSGVVPEKPKMVIAKSTEAFGLSDAVLEVKFQDSRTGVNVFTLWDTRQTGEYKRLDVKAAMRHAEETIHHWTQTLIDYMDKAYAK